MNTLLDVAAAVPPGWPFPFTPIAAAALALAVIYAAAYVLAPQDQE
jgi:hypothetical protein